MKIDELILLLKELKKKYGNCRVYKNVCGAVSENLDIEYGKDIKCHNYDSRMDESHTGLFLDFLSENGE
jgi:hypothetical protein